MTDSTILVKSPDGWKVKATLGLGILTVIVILAFMYHFQVGVVVLVTGLGVGARVWVWAIHQHKLAEFERRRLEAEVRKIEAEAIKAKVHSFFVETNTGVFVLDGIVINSFYPAVTASKLLADAPVLTEPEKPKLRKLLEVKFIHMLIVGPTNVGKTTVANHLIDNAPNGTICLAVDPQGKFNVWPRRVADVIGTGRDYRAIDARLVALIAEMDRRYNSDEPHFQKILIVVDEWLSVLENCPHAREFFGTIGSEARKVNMSLVITTISSTVDDLNVSAAVRDNLVQLTLNRTLKDQNQGGLKWSRNDVELVELPGPYIDREPLRLEAIQPPLASTPVNYRGQAGHYAEQAEEPPIELDAGPVPPVPTEDELRICELWDQGTKSLRAIHAGISDTKFGGRQAEEIKEVLRRFGRVE